MSKRTLTHEQLLNELDYNSDTGAFKRKIAKGGKNIGDLTGCIRENKQGYRYLVISLNDYQHRAHWLAFFYIYKAWPKGEIDHINGNSLDNSINNLRDVSRKTNTKNRRIPSNNKSGIMGISKCKQTDLWESYINIDGKKKHLGRYPSFNDAVISRKMAEYKYDYHPNHGRE